MGINIVFMHQLEGFPVQVSICRHLVAYIAHAAQQHTAIYVGDEAAASQSDNQCQPVEFLLRLPGLAVSFIIAHELAALLCVGDIRSGIIIILQLGYHRLAHVFYTSITFDNLLQLFVSADIPFAFVDNLQKHHIAVGTVIINIINKLVGIFAGLLIVDGFHDYNGHTDTMLLLLSAQLCEHLTLLLRSQYIGIIYQARRCCQTNACQHQGCQHGQDYK